MEWIFGGLGALCCAGTIGGIGYGLYRCCKNNTLTAEENKQISILNKNGGNCIITEFKASYGINNNSINFDITIPIDWNKLKNNKNIDNVPALKDIKEIAKQVELKNEIDRKNKLIAAAIQNKHPIYYYLSFTLDKNGKVMVRSNGIMDRNKNPVDIGMEKFANILKTLKSCLWQQQRSSQNNFCVLVDVFSKYSNNVKQLFGEICRRDFNITAYNCPDDGDIKKNNNKSVMNLIDVEHYDERSV